MRLSPPKFIRRLAPSLIWEMPPCEEVYLTFDDGPTPEITDWVLGELSKYDAKATFFCLGKNAEMHPEIFARVKEAGHQIGNHTYSHQKGWRMTLEGYLEDIELANQFLQSDLFRPPYGQITPNQAHRINEHYSLIMWDIISQDYNQLISPRTCLRNVTKHVRGGSIVVFHDSAKSFRNLKYALPRTLDHIYSRGLKCASIEL